MGQSDEVTDDDCRKLGAYYMSDPELGFKELDPENMRVGWSVRVMLELQKPQTIIFLRLAWKLKLNVI